MVCAMKNMWFVLIVAAWCAACSAPRERTIHEQTEPEVSVIIRATTESFSHADGLEGQTPLFASGGVRSLELLRNEDDDEPLTVFDHDAASVEVGYNHGDETVLAVVPASSLEPGRYRVARVIQRYSRYSIEATHHTVEESVIGELNNLLVVSDGTDLDGEVRDSGYYDYHFDGGDVTFGATGTDGIVADYATTASAYAQIEDGQWAVYFDIDIDIPTEPEDRELIIEVNMFESFRWTDVSWPGFEEGVYDFTPISYEPVSRFGGNTFDVRFHTVN